MSEAGCTRTIRRLVIDVPEDADDLRDFARYLLPRASACRRHLSVELVIELRKRDQEVCKGFIESITTNRGAGALVDRRSGRLRRSVETRVPAQTTCGLAADLTTHWRLRA